MTSKPVVAVDIGGTTIQAGYSESGEKFNKTWDFKRADYPAPVDWLEEMLDKDENLSECRWAVGVPGSVVNGREVEETPNLSGEWAGVSIPTALQNLGLDWRLENDANLAALGEAYHGAGTEVEHLVCVTLGTGVGAGIIIDRKLYTGGSGAAGELGHLEVEPGGRRCGCGREGCLEAYASATGMKRSYKKLTGQQERSGKIVQMARRDDKAAREALRQTGIYLGRGLALLINLLEPQLILFAGGMSQELDALKPWIEKGKDPHLFAARTKNIPLERAKLDDPALYGGLALA